MYRSGLSMDFAKRHCGRAVSYPTDPAYHPDDLAGQIPASHGDCYAYAELPHRAFQRYSRLQDVIFNLPHRRVSAIWRPDPPAPRALCGVPELDFTCTALRSVQCWCHQQADDTCARRRCGVIYQDTPTLFWATGSVDTLFFLYTTDISQCKMLLEIYFCSVLYFGCIL